MSDGGRFAAYAGKTVVVTGGAGFIGSRLCVALAQAGAHVVAVDNDSNGNAISHRDELEAAGVAVRAMHSNCIFAYSNNQTDILFHLACKKKAGNASLDTFAQEHMTYWNGLLDNVQRYWPQCRVVFTSTGSVHEAAWDRSNPISSAYPMVPCPRSDYAITKLAAEHILQRYVDGGMHGVVARLYNVIGAGQSYGSGAGFLPTWCMQALRGQALTVRGDGRQIRTLTAVADVVEALMVLGLEGEGTYELASGQHVPIDEAVSDLVSIAAGDGYRTAGMKISGVVDALDVRGSHADLSRLLGRSPAPWYNAVAECWEWYKALVRDGRIVL